MIANKGVPGVDGFWVETLAKDDAVREAWLLALAEELRTKTYRPSPVLRVYIWKDQAKTKRRALGIPTVKDRVVQSAAVIVLQPILEADFHDHSYAYRPKRRTHQAMDKVKEALLRGKVEVVDADLSSYFDMIPHRELLQLVAKRVSDGSVLRLIKTWLRAPIVEGMKSKRRYPHVEPSAKSQAKLRDKVREVLEVRTRNQPAVAVVRKVNQITRGWATAFHYGNSTHVLSNQQAFVRNRLRRWLWRKYSRTHGLFEFFTDDRLHGQYKLWHWPLTAAWKP